MMEAGWSARRVARQLGRSDRVARRCWDQWIREMLFTRRPDSGCPRQTSRREDRHIMGKLTIHSRVVCIMRDQYIVRNVNANRGKTKDQTRDDGRC
ncbi:HTH_Tnp_Tc3_2 domain-containing protein [Trichonephila clavipes]|nr:HTH_Tnp_Tc3_2 domain-containing protein [Trichonephila clavipes]